MEHLFILNMEHLKADDPKHSCSGYFFASLLVHQINSKSLPRLSLHMRMFSFYLALGEASGCMCHIRPGEELMLMTLH